MQLVFILILSTCCLARVLSVKEIKKEWLKFNQKYEKKYRSGEKMKSFQNFKRNFEKIDRHNKRFEQKLTTYKMAINQFSDMDLKQIENEYMGLKISEIETRSFQNIPQVQSQTENNLKLPDFMDWRDKGAITPVKNQLGCGSCWAFSSTGALEAHYFLKYNKTVVLSEQNLVDCVKKNYGCQGGWMIPCFDYVQTNGGINSEYKYPYQAVNGKCRYQSSDITATCSGYNSIRQGDEQHLLEIVATRGPVSVAIEVNLNFINYVKGIYNDLKCSHMVNHAVLVVGYGTENGQDYWLVKNSWGTKWGENGFIKMARNKQNQCAIASYAVYPLV